MRADLDHGQAVQALAGHRAVDVEEVGGERGRGLRVQELAPRGVLVAEFEQLALDPLVSQVLFSVASRSISVTISVLTGGRPVRYG